MGLGEPIQAMEVILLETISDAVIPLLVEYQSTETSDITEADAAAPVGLVEHCAWSKLTPLTSYQESTSQMKSPPIPPPRWVVHKPLQPLTMVGAKEIALKVQLEEALMLIAHSNVRSGMGINHDEGVSQLIQQHLWHKPLRSHGCPRVPQRGSGQLLRRLVGPSVKLVPKDLY